MGSGKRNYRALRYSSRKWKKRSSLQETKEKSKELNGDQKKAMEELMKLYNKKRTKE